MEKSKVDTFILTNFECFESEDIPFIRLRLEHAEESKWTEISCTNFHKPQTALMLSVFGGPIGVDRIYIGDYLLGVFKTITCGGVLVWAFIDQFLIKKAARERNKEILMNVLNR